MRLLVRTTIINTIKQARGHVTVYVEWMQSKKVRRKIQRLCVENSAPHKVPKIYNLLSENLENVKYFIYFLYKLLSLLASHSSGIIH